MPIQYADGNNFTFNKSTSVDTGAGYHSRVIFTYVPFSGNPNLMGYGDWFDNSEGNGLAVLQENNLEACHGNYVLPRSYFKKGKSFRIKGSLLCSIGDGGTILNFRFGIADGSNNYYTLAIQNNNAFNAGVIETDNTPVDFEFNIGYYDSTYFYGDGYYQINRDSYSSGGSNVDNIYVPVWENSTTSLTTTNPSSSKIILWFNGYGTTVAEVYITNLIIEEIA